jgi:hypothetical protein
MLINGLDSIGGRMNDNFWFDLILWFFTAILFGCLFNMMMEVQYGLQFK